MSCQRTNFKPVSAEVFHNESIRDAFINGLQSNLIRQRLLENKTLNLQAAFNQARSLGKENVVADTFTRLVALYFPVMICLCCTNHYAILELLE